MPDNKLIVIALADPFQLGMLTSALHVSWSLATGSWLGVGNDPVYVKSRCFETFPFPDTDTGLTQELRERIAALAEQIDAHRKRQQTAHPVLTLTGMYNVLEALREGRELTAKEKAIHDQGLVGVLKDLHDELDATVLDAYGLGDVPQAQWLQRLVTLNAQRADEERRGNIRWLRPEFQNPQAVKDEEPTATAQPSVQAEFILETSKKAVPLPGTAGGQPWPATLPAQVRAVADVLTAGGSALSIADIEASFKGRGAWKRSLPRILATLEALGRSRHDGDGWRAG